MFLESIKMFSVQVIEKLYCPKLSWFIVNEYIHRREVIPLFGQCLQSQLSLWHLQY